MTGRIIEHRIQWAGSLIVAGLIVQLLTSFWTHPLAFVCFLMVGCPLVAAGILFFLYSLVSREAH